MLYPEQFKKDLLRLTDSIFFLFIIHFSSIFFKKFKNAIIIVEMNKRYGQLKSFTSYLKKIYSP